MHTQLNTIDNNEKWLRSVLLLVAGLMALIITIDVTTMPTKTNPYFNTIRFLGQFLPILVALLITYINNYQRFYQSALLTISVIFSLVTLYIIWSEWIYSEYAYAYEGLMINVYFFFFITRMGMKQAIIYSVVIVSLFLLLIIQHPIYGVRNTFNFVMLAIAHLIALVGVYRLHKVAQENQQYNQLLMRHSITDELTQIYNRKGYHNLATPILQHCQKQQLPLSLFLFDIDYFKEFNDQFGHAKGDEVLILQAKILQQIFPNEGEIISRFGGDEFLVVSAIDTYESQAKIDGIIKLWQTQPYRVNIDSDLNLLSCSMGICTAVPSQHDTLEDYFLVADKALYQAKENDKGGYIQSALNIS